MTTAAAGTDPAVNAGALALVTTAAAATTPVIIPAG